MSFKKTAILTLIVLLVSIVNASEGENLKVKYTSENNIKRYSNG